MMNARFPRSISPVLLVFTLGCGGGGGAHDAPEAIASADILYANSIRTTINDIRSAESPRAAAENAQYALEDMEGFEENEATADHLETYRQIHQGFQEISQMQGATAEDINAKLDALAALADQLPRMEGGTTDASGGESG